MGLLSCNALSDKCFLGLNDFFLIIKALAVTICHLEEEGEEKSPEKYEIHLYFIPNDYFHLVFALEIHIWVSLFPSTAKDVLFGLCILQDDDDEVVGTIIKHATKKICGTPASLTLLVLEDGFWR